MNSYPINQVFLGDSQDLEMKLQLLKAYEDKLKGGPDTWSKIDAEINTLTEDQKLKLFSKDDYIKINSQLQNKVQLELLNLVKSKIEGDSEGRKLLEDLLEVIKTQKKQIVEESNKELELFNKFKEFSKNNSDITYEQFIKCYL